MADSIKMFGLLVVLCVLVLNIQGRPQDTVASSTEKSTWEKVKDGLEHGFNVAYDEAHCVAHKVKDLVKSHDHDDGTDPCENKPYKQTTVKSIGTTLKSIDLRVENLDLDTTTSRPL